MALIFSLGTFLPNQANAQLNQPDCKTCSLKDVYSKDEMLEKLNELGVTIEDTNKNDQKLVKKLIKEQKKMDKEINKQLAKGFKDYKDAEMFLTFNNTHLGGYDYEKAIIYATLLKNKAGDIALVSAWVDPNKKELIKYTVGTITNENPEKFNELVSYEKVKDTEGDFTASDFKWNGKSFACGLSGVFACITYCGVVGLACGPGAAACGTVCDLACGAAFAYACS
ncbi:putative immunity protein/bacteriocin [Oikeobacillus pervagus]|uniref:Immunity protein/bacteriocin n=1 Tax=Oikeobacillus pervagus TaxID=1325931 RepID=A0AAJ1T422_9BACI|nr:putative immunity/bacteriocin fusion bifunctional protein [Oikeobacillus pervagus]MDQ0216867.1 putative immunity protein/bacteriocin [Oikeobacillus pervagus]